jgi:hypothetical protein
MNKLIATSQQPQSSGLRQFLSFFKADSLPHRVRLISGRYLTLRRIISWPLLLLFFLTSWLMWNDLPLVHFDLVAKQFRLGSVIFWPEDLMVLRPSTPDDRGTQLLRVDDIIEAVGTSQASLQVRSGQQIRGTRTLHYLSVIFIYCIAPDDSPPIVILT